MCAVGGLILISVADVRVPVVSRLRFRGEARHPFFVLRQTVSNLPPRRLGTGEHMQLRTHARIIVEQSDIAGKGSTAQLAAIATMAMGEGSNRINLESDTTAQATAFDHHITRGLRYGTPMMPRRKVHFPGPTGNIANSTISMTIWPRPLVLAIDGRGALR